MGIDYGTLKKVKSLFQVMQNVYWYGKDKLHALVREANVEEYITGNVLDNEVSLSA